MVTTSIDAYILFRFHLSIKSQLLITFNVMNNQVCYVTSLYEHVKKIYLCIYMLKLVCVTSYNVMIGALISIFQYLYLFHNDS